MKLNVKNFTISLIIVFLFFCGYPIFVNENHTSTISIGTFTKLPSTIDGYTCYIFNSLEDQKNNIYLGAGDDTYRFFIFLNQELQDFSLKDEKLISGDYSMDLTEEKILSTEKSDEYEEFNIKGNLVITNLKNNQNITKNYVGHCSW